MNEAVRQALALTRDSSARDRTADITTIGRRTGRPRRIEIWFYRVGDINYLSGLPGVRGWYANLLAEPNFVLHLRNGIRADLPARGRPVTDQAERHHLLSSIVYDLNQPSNPARIVQPTPLAEWLKAAPLVEISFSGLRVNRDQTSTDIRAGDFEHRHPPNHGRPHPECRKRVAKPECLTTPR